MKSKSQILGLLSCVLLSLFTAGCGEGKSSKDGTTLGEITSVGTTAPAAPKTDTKVDVRINFTSIVAPDANEAKELKAAGATFPQPLYKAWFGAYGEKIGVKVGYDGTGSGAGIKSIQNREVDIAGSDAPMTDEQISLAKGGEVLHIPTAFGAIVATYNLPGVTRQVRLTGEVLASIYLGEITKWNDPRIVADNPHLGSVNQRIITVHRGDGSGTTYGFTEYLSASSSAWESRVGKGTSVTWPVGIGAEGNKGVANEVKDNPYSIGYVELSYAISEKMAYAQVKNRAGKFIEPSLETVTAAAAGASPPSDLRFSIINAAGDRSYPIVTGTWVIVYKNQTDPTKAIAIARLLWFMTHDAQQVSTSLNYAPVPKEITDRSEQLIRQINTDGRPALR